MKESDQKHISVLEEIIADLADIWPGDREMIMQVGARLEDTIQVFEGQSSRLEDLVALSWKGMIHLYESDDYFFSVKTAVMQAINTIREYALHEGNIEIQMFEKAGNDLQKALSGDAESLMNTGSARVESEADTTPTSDQTPAPDEAPEKDEGAVETPAPDEAPKKDEGAVETPASGEAPEKDEDLDEVINRSLNDLGMMIMKVQPENLDAEIVSAMQSVLSGLLERVSGQMAGHLQEALSEIEKISGEGKDEAASRLDRISRKIEEAVHLEMNLEASAENPVIDSGQSLSELEEALPPNDIELSDEGDEIEETENQVYARANQVFQLPEDLDTGLLPEYITECNELIEVAEEALLDMEHSPDDPELIHTVFRSFHTIKGTSAFMGLSPVSEFTHSVETLLDMVRENQIPFDAACADITFGSIDTVKKILQQLSGLGAGDELTNPVEYDRLMQVLTAIFESGLRPQDAMSAQKKQEAGIRQENLQPSQTGTEGVSGEATRQTVSEQVTPEPAARKATTEQTASEQGVSGEATRQTVSEQVTPEPAARQTTSDQGTPEESTRKAVSGQGSFSSPVGEHDSDLARTSADKSREFSDNDVVPMVNGNPAEIKRKAKERKSAEADATVRVNVERLDRLVDMVGELVIAHSVVAQDPHIAADPELSRKVTHSTKILRELQDTSLTLRMVPLKVTFHKMNRLARDLARKAGKTVSFETSGEETEMDRNMVDILNEPLIHMLRNALDHGIEDIETRRRQGKPETASIILRAYQAGGKVVIEIEDDGRGLNKEKILEKALSKGMIDPERKMTDNEIYRLIFQAGFSTADKVTDLSGRGVGMDVVRRSIDKVQGKVDVYSEPGKGTRVTLELPFTLAITDGMLVRIGRQRIIIPTVNIEMTFRAREEDLFTLFGNSEQVKFQGHTIPVIRMHQLFSVPDAKENIPEGTLVVINNNKKKYALLVDEVIGQQQLVGKSISMPEKMKNISGGAILGDGQVGLILDTVALLN